MAARGLLGRESELRQVEGFLDRATNGHAVLVIEGEAGIGKTSLWTETVRRAAELGVQVYSCRPASAEAKLSFSALADLLERVPEEAFASLPDPQRHAVEVALLRTPPRRGTADARAAATAVRSLMTSLADASPVLVAIDDAQWLDVSSARAVDFALRRVGDVPVSLLVARRTGASDGAARLENALADADVVPIGPLSLGATHELLKRRLGTSIPRRLLVRVHETAGGNPFFALEVGRVVVERDNRASDPLPVPDDLAELVLRRVRRLRPSTQEALLVVAAAGQPDARLLAAVLDDASDALDEAKDAGLLREDGHRFAPSHPLYGAAVYSAASRRRRREVHQRLAEVVREPEERARHLALAAAGPDASVVAALRSAADAAQARGALDAAAELVDLALRLTPDDATDTAPELRLELGVLLRLTGDVQRARTIFEELAAEASGVRRARAFIELAAVLYWAEGAVAAVDCLDHALLAAHDVPMIQAKAHADIGAYCDFDLEKADRHAQIALRLCEEAGERADLFVQAEALSVSARCGLMLGRGLRHDDIARAIEIERVAIESEPSVAVVGRATTSSGQWLRYVDDFAGARARLENARREALEEGDESALPNILQHLAQTELWSGNWGLAVNYADSACEIAAQLGLHFGGPSAAQALVDAHVGKVDRARETATGGFDIVKLNPLAAPLYLRVLGFLELSLDDPGAAAPLLTSALQHLDEVRILEPGVLRIHGDAVEALVGVGDLERAEGVLVPWEKQGQRIGLAWSLAVSARCRGLLEAARGRSGDALETLDRALVEHANLPMPFELGRTLLAKGQVERRAKQRAAAKESLAAALDTFEHLGAPLWAEKARAELARVGLRRSAEELTEGERRVAELTASGLTNREVAARLYMSPKTVEANLARVYRKLGIHSRAELGARLAGAGDSEPQT
jgi:DNA-binding CsgD family transcriptional regulator